MFWSLTLALFLRLLERHRAAERRADHRAGTVAATMANTTRTAETDKLWGWRDFFPEGPEAEEEQDEEEMLTVMSMWTHHRPGARPN